jgi:MraZ protein
MVSEVAKAPIIYNSVYKHGVDPKRRLQIPAKWRPEDTRTELTLIVWPKMKEGPCLRVLPPEAMARLMRDIDAVPNDDLRKPTLKRVVGSESVQVSVDKAGRICIPEEMATSAGVNGEAVLVGMLDRFEIWSPERYEQVRAADRVVMQEAFRLME